MDDKQLLAVHESLAHVTVEVIEPTAPLPKKG